MRKIFLGLVLLVFSSINLNANTDKKSILGSSSVVDTWTVIVKNYFYDTYVSRGTNFFGEAKVVTSNISYEDAERKALNLCKEDKELNVGKPEGCVIYSVKENYKQIGLATPAPFQINYWLENTEKFRNKEEFDRLETEKKLKEQQIVKEKKLKEEQRQLTLEKEYGKECTKFTKGSDKYKNCLEEKDKHSKAIELALKKSKEEEIIKLEKMSPDDRRAYNCSEKFGFRKGSDKFKDCVFKIYQAEVELEKLELQKQLLKANIELAKANADRQDRLAQAQAETAKMQSLAAQQQANSARTAETLALLDMSLRLLAPPAAPPINRTTCSFNGRFMNCF